MKLKVPFLIPALFPLLFSLAEKPPIIKVYAYSQAIARGKDPGKGIINENGTEEKESARPGINYLIYLEHEKVFEIKPEHVWIKGKRFEITSVLKGTPILLEPDAFSGESKKKILVPGTTGKVFQLLLSGTATGSIKTPDVVKKIINNSELVVSYFWKGKRYFAGIKKIKMLEPIAAM